MPLGNVVRKVTNFSLEARKSYALGVRFLRGSDGSRVDLTGATVRIVVNAPKRQGGGAVITQDAEILVNPTFGTVQFKFQATDTDLAAGAYPYVVTLLGSTGFSTAILKGEVNVHDNADLATTGIFPGISTSSNLAAYVEDGDLVNVTVENVDGLSIIVNQMILDWQAASAAVLADLEAVAAGVDVPLDLAQAAATAAAASATSAAASATLAEILDNVQIDARTLANDSNPASAIRAQMDARYSTPVLDDDLNALAAAGSGVDKLPYYTGVGAAALTDLSPFSRSLLDETTAALWKVALFGTLPAATVDLGTVLSGAGLRTAGTAYPITTTGAVSIGVTTLTGRLRRLYTALAADTTLSTSHSVVGASASAAVRTITLPTAVAFAGAEYIIIKTDATANVVNIQTTSAQTINGVAPPLALTTQWQAVHLYSDGAGWIIAGNTAGGGGTDASLLSSGTLPNARLDAELQAIAGLTSAADQLPYFTGSGTAALTTLSSFIRTLIDDTSAAGARGTLDAAQAKGVTTAASAATPSPVGSRANNLFVLTAQAAAAPFAAPSGTPAEGNGLTIKIIDNGTTRAVTWDPIYTAPVTGIPLLANTVPNKRWWGTFMYDATASKWQLIAAGQEA